MIPLLVAAVLSTSVSQSVSPGDPGALSREHESHRFVTVAAPCLTPTSLAAEIERLVSSHKGSITVETVGSSFLGKDIRMLTVGRGAKAILLWSQMHGDEPTATPALLDLADFVAREQKQPDIARILDTFTLRMIPMLNPDGAANYERRNAQGIDINRDALMLTTPEGRLLKSIRERFSPILAFNLHDQSRRVTVGSTGVLSSISLLAVAGDQAGTMTPGRMRAKKVASRIVKTLSPFIPGGIARYDEDWNPRAFGDNVTAWGSPVVLIESGGFPRGGGFKDLTRFNFIALMSILDGLAKNDLADETPEAYDVLLRNQADAYADVSIGGASFLEPKSGQWFDGDIAFDLLASDQTVSGCAAIPRTGSRVVEIGDGRVVTPGRKIEGRGVLVAPLARDHTLKPGEVSVDELLALRPGPKPSSRDPRAVLAALRLSPSFLSRGGPASFVVWTKGRYFAIIDGAGFDAAFP